MNEKRQAHWCVEDADALASKSDGVESRLEHDVLRSRCVDEDAAHGGAKSIEIDVGPLLGIDG